MRNTNLRRLVIAVSGFFLLCHRLVFGQSTGLPSVRNVEFQPLAAQVKRVVEALDYLGSPLSAEERRALDAALAQSEGSAGSTAIQQVLDPHCLVGLTIN